LSRSGKSAPKLLEPEPYKGLEFDFIIFDEASTVSYYDPWDKPPKDPNRMDPDPFEARWLREKRVREQQELLDIMRRKLLEPVRYERKPERGDYLVYYLGGPNNATQEYFWDKILPKDSAPWDVAETAPLDISPSSKEPVPTMSRRHRYKLVVIPKNETPFATVQVYLALYQEPPL
jgi:hypothetical protein